MRLGPGRTAAHVDGVAATRTFRKPEVSNATDRWQWHRLILPPSLQSLEEVNAMRVALNAATVSVTPHEPH